MREFRSVAMEHEVQALITGVTYAQVPFWYGVSQKDLKLDLILPKNRENHVPQPLLIWVCGGAYMVNDRSVWVPELMDFARAGYTVASVEYRGTNEVHFPDPLCDVKAAIRYLRAHAAEYCIDPDHVFIMGESAGGTMAALVGTTGNEPGYDQGAHLDQSSAVQGVIDFYGPTDFKISEECLDQASGDDVPAWSLEAFLGTTDYQTNLVKASAIHHIDNSCPPCLILHGTADPLVDPSHSITFYERLQEQGIPSRLILLEGAVHGDDMFFQNEIKQEILTFLKENC